MAPRRATASAPGKLILFGEPAVVHGATALAGALSDLRASTSATVTPSRTPPASATASVSPYCSESEYVYFPRSDVSGDSPLGASLVPSERHCARACCDVPACDGYAFADGLQGANCFFVGNVSYLIHSHAFSAGIRKRAL